MKRCLLYTEFLAFFWAASGPSALWGQTPVPPDETSQSSRLKPPMIQPMPIKAEAMLKATNRAR